MKKAQKQEKLIARTVLAASNLIDWRHDQLQDPEISVFLLGKEIGEQSAWQEIAAKGTAAKVYWSYWDSLEIQSGVLYKRWETPFKEHSNSIDCSQNPNQANFERSA